MDIAVLIKQVPVSNDVSVDPETHALIRSSSEGMINPADLNAIDDDFFNYFGWSTCIFDDSITFIIE